ncbi:MAG: peroxiredoxin-like family protein [Arenicellales bacterium]|nr:peroxiredoxin-like family protein [Arenicellales bacterium]
MTMLIPRQPVPQLEIDTVDEGVWRLAEQKPEHFTLIVFYRGWHCPICGPYLRDLDRKSSEFSERGVSTVAISSDDETRARTAKEKWKIENLPIGYGISIDQGRQWGLFVSSGIGKTSVGVEEPDLFFEPGLFLVRPDGTLYFSTVQTMPFARPTFADILKALDVIIPRNYPARGEVVRSMP